MRTTLTIDDDVAVRLERLRREGDASFKALVNEALRRGLDDLRKPQKKRKPFKTRPIEGVTCLLDNVDNVAEVIAIIEGELYK
jgi:hypothetical protein